MAERSRNVDSIPLHLHVEEPLLSEKSIFYKITGPPADCVSSAEGDKHKPVPTFPIRYILHSTSDLRLQ